MSDKKIEVMKIIMKGNRIMTRRQLFEKKEEFHREQAKLPFEEKIKILTQLQKIASSIENLRNDKKSSQRIWEISH